MSAVWHEWYQRWEAMQSAYVPERLFRFDLMVETVAHEMNATLDVLDLGCGSGSLGLHVRARRPNAAVVAVDSNTVLLEMGRGASEHLNASIRYQCADLRCPTWWDGLTLRFDAVFSATALHWLGEQHLREIYGRAIGVLRPGAWFVNSDHIALDDVRSQAENMSALAAWQKQAFAQTKADTWDSFWEHFATAPGRENIESFRGVEGSEEGLPEAWHIQAIEQAGFTNVTVRWRKWGDAIIAAQRRRPTTRGESVKGPTP
jgi:trans-aconitate methyltransferase